jgi:hypothetical protein
MNTALYRGPGSNLEETQIVDSRNISKAPIFDGKRENWERWKYVFVAWVSAVNAGFPGLLEKAESSVTPPEHASMSPGEIRLSRALLTILMGYAPDFVNGTACARRKWHRNVAYACQNS